MRLKMAPFELTWIFRQLFFIINVFTVITCCLVCFICSTSLPAETRLTVYRRCPVLVFRPTDLLRKIAIVVRSTLFWLLTSSFWPLAITLAKNGFGAGSSRKYVLTMLLAEFLYQIFRIRRPLICNN